MPRIAIGMPVFNGGVMLERAIASIEAQTLADFTVFAADNASTDGSWDILRAWAARDSRVVLHRHPHNIGALANFRSVLERAEAERFLWHACDDWTSPGYLETLNALLDANPDCALACGDVVKHGVEGGEKRRRFPDLAGRSPLGRTLALLKRPRAPWIYGLFRRQALARALLATAAFSHAWGGDYIILMRFILEGRICGTSEAEFHYRMTAPADQAYRPLGWPARRRFFMDYLAANLGVFRDAALTPYQRMICLPVLLRHVLRGL